MSEDSGKTVKQSDEKSKKTKATAWGPLATVLLTIALYFLSQFVVGILFGIFFGISGWTEEKIDKWTDSTFAQFLFIAFSGLATLGTLWLFLRHRRLSFRMLGFGRKPQWRDVAYVAAGFFVYFVLLIAASVIVGQILGINTEQEQDVGFEQAKAGAGGLALVFLSLVVIPPIVEEVVFRGFLFGGLRTKLSLGWATVITSVLFAAPHLLGGTSGLLWIAAVDTFVLSLVLCYVREKTGALWTAIGIHAVKNSLAFIAIFVVQ